MKKFSQKLKTVDKNFTSGLPVKKKAFGQHFLRKNSVVDNMINAVTVTPDTTVMEIGCGDGFLTKAILDQTQCPKLLCFEIDPEWADYVRKKITTTRLDLRLQNILDVSFEEIASFYPLVMLANLPYQITFPILYRLQKNKNLFKDIVIMIQEEVAQKLAASGGKNFSAATLFFQHHFKIKLLDKIEPEAFNPPPKVFSRLVQLTPQESPNITDEDNFWAMVKLCFQSPRQTLKNNLRTTHFDLTKLSVQILGKRAQQMNMADFISMWDTLRN